MAFALNDTSKPLVISLPPNVENQLMLALNNFRLARLFCLFLIPKGPSPPPIATLVEMQGGMHIEAVHCGLITNPIIHSAVLDVRRTLAFLNLKIDASTRHLVVLPSDEEWPNDCSLAKLGVFPPTPAQIVALSHAVIGKPPAECLSEMVSYANKGLAHFSFTEAQPNMNSISDACLLMFEAIHVYLYDATFTARPRLFVKEELS